MMYSVTDANTKIYSIATITTLLRLRLRLRLSNDLSLPPSLITSAMIPAPNPDVLTAVTLDSL